MAIYHLSGTLISRSKGRSAVACAAYRTAERLEDERYGKTHDYTKKEGVVHSEILLPEGAPSWMADREVLWNRVEASEKRKDAQLAREFNLSLPRELTLRENIALARDFVQEAFVKRGMVADLCVHDDVGKDGERQPHAHVMLTLREVLPDGEAGKGDKGDHEGFGKKVRAWNDKALLLTFRELWAETANRHLSLHGHDLSIDHRSLAAQHIELEPQYKIGASVARERLARLEDHQRIARENGERLRLDPSLALNAITRQQSTFTHHDVARFVSRHTVDADQFALVYEKVKGHEAVVALGKDEKGRERFTTREMLVLESGMMEKALFLSAERSHGVRYILRLEALDNQKEATGYGLSSEQTAAFQHVLETGGLRCLVGFAGTGKSTLLGTARLAWEKAGFTVQGVTLSGIAAEKLQGGSGILSRTFASRCHYWDKGEQTLSSRDVLVVDEAGMLSSRQMARLMEEAHSAGAKVVLVGDPQQLQAIEAGAAFRAISEEVPTVTLTDIKRQREEWQREATQDLAKGEVHKAIKRYDSEGHLHAFDTTLLAKEAMVKAWNEARLSQSHLTTQSQLMLAYRRDDVLELNKLARYLRQEGNELGEDVVFQTGRGERALASGDRVYFLKNDRNLGVMNGTLGTIETIEKENKMLTVRIDHEGGGIGVGDTASKMDKDKAHRVSFTMERYDQVEYGYAATIHKAQGVTVDRSFVLASTYLDAHSSYVGLSRHRESVDLFYGRDAFLSRDDVMLTLGRNRAKDVTLDYVEQNKVDDFAGRRGFFGLSRLFSGLSADALIQREEAGHKKEQKKERKEKYQEKQREVDVQEKQGAHGTQRKEETHNREEKIRFSAPEKDAWLQKHLDAVDKLLDEERRAFHGTSKDRNVRSPSLLDERGTTLEKAPTKGLDKAEVKACALVAQYERLVEMVEKGGRSRSLAETHLETLSSKMAKQKEVMEYVCKNHKEIATDIQMRERARERSLDRGEMEL